MLASVQIQATLPDHDVMGHVLGRLDPSCRELQLAYVLAKQFLHTWCYIQHPILTLGEQD